MLEEHLGYVADRTRLELMRTAVAKVIGAGYRVADIGCGTGILGLLCLRAGAAEVAAIDSTAMIEVAREAFTRAGLAHRGFFIRGHSHRIELPEPVDVLICDHVGYFGFDYGIVHTLQDARQRFLAPDGQVIPKRIKLQIGAIESKKARDSVDGWVAERVPEEFHWLRQHAVNTKHAIALAPEALLAGPSGLGEIDLCADSPDFFSWSTTLRVERDGVMHGLAGWFECELADEVWMTNSPLAAHRIDRPQAFLPIEEAVEVKSGDLVKATIMARPAENQLAWTVELPASGCRFRHSTWQGLLLAPDDLIRAHPDRVPRLSREGEARLTVLGYCDGRRSAREIEQAVLLDHPNLFPSVAAISSFVTRTLALYTE